MKRAKRNVVVLIHWPLMKVENKKDRERKRKKKNIKKKYDWLTAFAPHSLFFPQRMTR